MKQTNLIIGCGYLGKSLLRLLPGQRNYVTNRSGIHLATKTTDLSQRLTLDINDKHTWHNLDGLSVKRGIRIYFMVPPSQINRITFSNFIEHLNKLDIQSATLVSSTVVYGNKDRIVDADSEVDIDSDRAQRQHLVEHDWFAAIKKGAIVRFAGIYGSKRIIGKNTILNGGTISANPKGWLNLIHVSDGAKLVKRVSEMEKLESIELACDGKPIKRCEYYGALAEALNYTQVKFSQDDNARGIGRRCDNRITIERTGWRPEHTDFRSIF